MPSWLFPAAMASNQARFVGVDDAIADVPVAIMISERRARGPFTARLTNL